MDEFSNQVVLFTGGGAGIGRAAGLTDTDYLTERMNLSDG